MATHVCTPKNDIDQCKTCGQYWMREGGIFKAVAAFKARPLMVKMEAKIAADEAKRAERAQKQKDKLGDLPEGWMEWKKGIALPGGMGKIVAGTYWEVQGLNNKVRKSYLAYKTDKQHVYTQWGAGSVALIGDKGTVFFNPSKFSQKHILSNSYTANDKLRRIAYDRGYEYKVKASI